MKFHWLKTFILYWKGECLVCIWYLLRIMLFQEKCYSRTLRTMFLFIWKNLTSPVFFFNKIEDNLYFHVLPWNLAKKLMQYQINTSYISLSILLSPLIYKHQMLAWFAACLCNPIGTYSIKETLLMYLYLYF